MNEFISYPFIQRALFASIMVGILCPFVGNFVVLRRMSFFSDAISHAALAGIAAGILIGIDLSLSALAVAIIIACIIAFLSEKTTLSHDTIIGIAFSGAIASGVLLIGMLKGYKTDIFAFLFGDILAITNTDLLIIFITGLFTILILLIFAKPFFQISFNRELARVEGINVRLFEYFLFCIIAIVVTISLKVIGIILVTSLLIVPAAAAKNLSSSMKQLFMFSCAFGVISGIVGLFGSIYMNTSSGPTIVLVSISIFFLTLFRKKI
jgi:zinc transport system permease protein